MWVTGHRRRMSTVSTAPFSSSRCDKPALRSKYRKHYDSYSICSRNRPVIGIVANNEATASNSGRPIVLHVDTRRL